MKEIVLLSFGIGLGFYIKTLRDKNKAAEAVKKTEGCNCKV